MFSVGAGGYVWLSGGEWTPLLNSLKNLAYARLSNYDLIVIPLFLLMGQFATHGGCRARCSASSAAFAGHWRGGVAMAAVGACAASARSAVRRSPRPPPWARWRCPSCAGSVIGRLSTGTLAAGGTLGIMIPPSVPLVIYAILTQESIGKLFMAAGAAGRDRDARLHAGDPRDGGPPVAPAATRVRGRFTRAAAVAPVFGVFVGGHHRRHLRRLGEPDQAAAIGAAACGVLAVVSGGMLARPARHGARHRAVHRDDLPGAARRRPAEHRAGGVADAGRAGAVGEGQRLPPLLVMVAILVVYILLGCVMDSMAMILLTIPVFYPVVMGLDFWGLGDTDKASGSASWR